MAAILPGVVLAERTGRRVSALRVLWRRRPAQIVLKPRVLHGEAVYVAVVTITAAVATAVAIRARGRGRRVDVGRSADVCCQLRAYSTGKVAASRARSVCK